jgi:hypothetical protein
MANEINNLAAVLRAIGRQIAFGKRSPDRADRPERDLPILLLPHSATALTGSDRKRTERNLPYLLGHNPVEPTPVSPDAITAPRLPAIRLPRNDVPLLRLSSSTVRGIA